MNRYKRYAISAIFLLIIVVPSKVNAENEFRMKVSGIEESIMIDGVLESGKVSSITVDQRFNSIVFRLNDITRDSKMSVVIPRDIIREREEFNEIDFIVVADIEEIRRDISTKEDKKILTFTVPARTEEVEIIIASEHISVVPEFGLLVMLILAVSIGTLIIVSKRNLL